MKKQIIQFLLFSIPFLGISQLYTPGAGVTDIDGNTYQTIIINGQEWMAENLRTSTYANGDPIPNVTDNTQWRNLTTGAWAHNNNDNQYENDYGKLYNWYTTSDPRNVCPTDWHVPTYAVWTVLTDYLGGGSVAGGKMKSTGTQYWQIPNTDATNESGFSGLPGSLRTGNGVFIPIGSHCIWWSSAEYSADDAWVGGSLIYNNGSFGQVIVNKEEGFSIRCLKNITTDISEIKPLSKTLIKVFNLMGIETPICPNELQFYLYSDGSVEKKIIIEK